MTDGRKYQFQHTCTIEDADGDEMPVLCSFDMDGPDRNAKATLQPVKVYSHGESYMPEWITDEVADHLQRQAEVAWENGGYADAARYEKELGA